VDFLANVALFVPFGVAVAANGRTAGRSALWGAMLSIVIEACQWRLVPGRDASLGDLLANTSGAFLGATITQYRRTLLWPDLSAARRLAVAWAVMVVTLAFLASLALRPAVPEYRFWSQWTPVRGGYAPFEGELRGLSLSGMDIPVGVMLDPLTAPAAYAAGGLEVEAIVVPAPRIDGVALIARAGNPLGEQFQLAQRGTDLVARGRSTGVRAGLRSPSFVLKDGLRRRDTTARLLRFELLPGEARLYSASRHDTLRTLHRVTLGDAWQLVSPVESSRVPFGGAMGAAWLAALIAPLGYWVVRIRPATLFPVGALIALACLVAAPLTMGIAAGGIFEVAGVLVGLVLGGEGGRRFRRTAGRS
jgi:hypothetical protein